MKSFTICPPFVFCPYRVGSPGDSGLSNRVDSYSFSFTNSIHNVLLIFKRFISSHFHTKVISLSRSQTKTISNSITSFTSVSEPFLWPRSTTPGDLQCDSSNLRQYESPRNGALLFVLLQLLHYEKGGDLHRLGLISGIFRVSGDYAGWEVNMYSLDSGL